MSNLIKKDKGFTLIEIVLVLAIAGLLLVIVFLAVSGAQKSRRDSQRKNDLGQIAAQVENYASGNGGTYPATSAAFNLALTGTYKLSNGIDPLSGAVYTYTGLVTPTGAVSAGVLYTPGALAATGCDGAAMTSARTFKVQMNMEQGVACFDNK